MTRNSKSTGNLGEDAACAFLKENGYRIRTRSFRTKTGEIDVVAEKGNITAFVEVKTRKGYSYGEGIESVTQKKALRLRNLAAEYLSLTGFGGEIRFDVICVSLDRRGHVLKIEHIENAF